MKKREEVNYFDSFVNNSENALKASEILKEFVNNFDKQRSNQIEEMVHALEHEADGNQHKILNYLITDFLPPIDREDIIRISHRIDDIIDNIDELVININILNVDSLRDDVKEFIDLLCECCISVNKMLINFKNMKKFKEIKELVIAINCLEDRGDLLYQKAIKNLYINEKNPIEVIKWTTLYNCLEACFDSCENVADGVEEILMKNS